jgi:hypothetical protein
VMWAASVSVCALPHAQAAAAGERARELERSLRTTERSLKERSEALEAERTAHAQEQR